MFSSLVQNMLATPDILRENPSANNPEVMIKHFEVQKSAFDTLNHLTSKSDTRSRELKLEPVSENQNLEEGEIENIG